MVQRDAYMCALKSERWARAALLSILRWRPVLTWKSSPTRESIGAKEAGYVSTGLFSVA